MYLKEHPEIAQFLEQKIRAELLVKKVPASEADALAELVDD